MNCVLLWPLHTYSQGGEVSPRCPYHCPGNPVCSETEDCSPVGPLVAAEDGWTLEIPLPPHINHPKDSCGQSLCRGTRTAILLPVSVSNNLTEGSFIYVPPKPPSHYPGRGSVATETMRPPNLKCVLSDPFIKQLLVNAQDQELAGFLRTLAFILSCVVFSVITALCYQRFGIT